MVHLGLEMGAMSLLDVGLVLDPGMPCMEWGGFDAPRENPHFWSEWPGHSGTLGGWCANPSVGPSGRFDSRNLFNSHVLGWRESARYTMPWDFF